jgi:hypothetical protein
MMRSGDAEVHREVTAKALADCEIDVGKASVHQDVERSALRRTWRIRAISVGHQAFWGAAASARGQPARGINLYRSPLPCFTSAEREVSTGCATARPACTARTSSH